MKVTDKFVLFWRDYLGNWTKSPNPIKYWDKKWGGPVDDEKLRFFTNREFPTSEHLFMYIKAVHFKDWETAQKIVDAQSPKEAKDLGREVKGFDEAEWEKVREKAMFTAILHRSQYDQAFKDRVLKPEWENLEFVEASPYDKIWGIGLGEEQYDANIKSKWPGLNLLGKCITELRRYLKFSDWVSKWEEHAFFEEMIWCPSQIYYYFTDLADGQMYVVYCRWRWSDPWTIELVKVANPKNPRNWDWSLGSVSLLPDRGYKDEEYRKMEKDILDCLKAKFPHIVFPDKVISKNPDDWNGLKTF